MSGARPASQSSERRALLWVALGASLWGTDTIFRRPLTASLSSTHIVLLEYLILSVALAIPLWLMRVAVDRLIHPRGRPCEKGERLRNPAADGYFERHSGVVDQRDGEDHDAGLAYGLFNIPWTLPIRAAASCAFALSRDPMMTRAPAREGAPFGTLRGGSLKARAPGLCERPMH